MIYLDYSATTPVNKDVLDSFNNACLKFIGNANSLHKLGIKIDELINEATKQIKNILKLNNKEIIYTSSSSEANNLALKGICLKYQNRGKHIITTKYEHSSINETLKYLETLGFEISYVKCNHNGVVDIDNLKSLIRDDTILVSICAVNSEIGILNPIEDIALLLKNYPKCFFHTDLTQSLGKIDINLDNVDLASISAHKIYGLKGIGALIKNDNLVIEPLIHGGKSTSIYRSGTPAHPLIVSFSKAIRLAYNNLDENYKYVLNLNNYLKSKLKDIENIIINSNENCIPHILNISIKGIKSETMMHALAEYDIYVSTKTACSTDDLSLNILELTNDIERAKSSIRISLSYLTTEEELDKFIDCLKICLNKLSI